MTTPEPDPRTLIDQLISEHARTGRPFSSADLRPSLDAATAAANILTPRLLAAQQAGLIEKIGTCRTSHREGKGRVIVLWRGVGVRARPPDRASLRRKAQRLLDEHRVTLVGDLTAAVTSDVQVHTVVRRGARWYCGCHPAGQPDCSHVLAVAMLAGEQPGTRTPERTSPTSEPVE